MDDTQYTPRSTPAPLGNRLNADTGRPRSPEAGFRGAGTDFASLHEQLPDDLKPIYHRSATDWIIDVLTPLMIFVMVYSVIFFLLDVRFVYTEVHDGNLRFVAFCYLLGIVALNRVIARDGSEESIIYITGLIGAVGFYTLFTTGAYDVGSFARHFISNEFGAAAFNMIIVAFIWWLTNRLMHECSIDENRTAGDIGILTGTLQRFTAFSRSDAPTTPAKPKKKKKTVSLLETTELEAIDPTTWKPPEERKKEAKTPAPLPSERLSARHPGISIFYFSVPVMLLFTLGYPVLMQGGAGMILAGHFYVGCFTVAALALLLMTSLGGLREYFRSRSIYFPAAIGWFWIALGLIMIAAVLIAATQLPKTGLPEMAYIEEHEYDAWSRNSTFQLKSSGLSAARIVRQAELVDRIGKGVLIFLGLFVFFALLRLSGDLAAYVGAHPRRFPGFVVRVFRKMDGFILKYLRLPKLPKRARRVRINPAVATSSAYTNPMRGEGPGSGADVSKYVAQSYDALCALAYDLGVPRRPDQTPYEFIESFPPELKNMKDEAFELTEMYVRSAYSNEAPNEAYLDRLRRFWTTYDKVRKRYIR